MPSSVFYNLKEEKKERITQAAIAEFTEYVYEDVQVKRIVEESKIARGSFYQYFEDVDDLFKYVLQYVTENVIASQRNELFVDPSMDAFDVLKMNFAERLRSSMTGTGLLVEHKILFMVKQSEKALDMFIETIGVIPHIGTQKITELLLRQYDHLTEEKIQMIDELLFPGIKQTVEKLLRSKIDVEEAIREIDIKFTIIKYGVIGEQR